MCGSLALSAAGCGATKMQQVKHFGTANIENKLATELEIELRRAVNVLCIGYCANKLGYLAIVGYKKTETMELIGAKKFKYRSAFNVVVTHNPRKSINSVNATVHATA